MHNGGVTESVIFDIENERVALLLQYNLMEKEIFSSTFDELDESEKVNLLSRFFNCSKTLGKSFKQGTVNGVEYKISQTNPNEITFGNQNHGIFVVINEQGVYSEICVDETNHYANLKNHDFTVILNRKVYVVDGDINEDKSLKEFYDILKPLCAEIVSKNSEYTLSPSGLGFFRTEISPEEKIMNHTDLSDEILSTHSVFNITKNNLSDFGISKKGDELYIKYSDLMSLAGEYNKKCLEVYNLIQKALNSDYVLGNKSR